MTNASQASDADRARLVPAAADEPYGAFFAHLNLGVLLIDPVGGRVVDANPVAVGQFTHATFDQEPAPGARGLSLEQAAAHIAEACRQHGTHLSVWRVHEDGVARDLEVYSGPIDLHGRRLLYCILHEVAGRDTGQRTEANSAAQQRLVMECAEDAIFVSDNAGRYLYANPAALKMMGYSLQELCALTIDQLVDAADLPRLPEHLDATRRGERRLLEWRMRRKDGSVLLAEFNTLQLPDGRFLAIGRDVSQRKQTEEKLQLAARVFEKALEGIVITDASATMIDVNQAFTRLTGYSREELIGNNPRMLHSGHQSAQDYRELWNTVLETGAWQGELWDRKMNGELFVTRVSITAVLDASGASKHYIGFFSDVTARRREQEKIEGLAYYDALTGLPNRVLFADRMQQALLAAQRQGGMVAVCCLDLDDFKPINDCYGHLAGDEVLAAIARRLQVSTRTQDTVARLGGDEFAMLLSTLHSTREAESVLMRVLHAVAQPCQLSSGASVRVTASLGVALYPEAGHDANTLMLHADEAMYSAKRKGKNQLHFFTRTSGA